MDVDSTSAFGEEGDSNSKAMPCPREPMNAEIMVGM